MFRLEHEMLESANRWLTGQGLLSKAEFYTPWGVCDVVGVSLSAVRIRKRLKLGQRAPIGPLRRVTLLNQIPDFQSHKSTTERQLKAEFSGIFSEVELEGELHRLIRDRFVVRSEFGRLRRLNGWAPLHRRIVAVELKLHRVKEAVFQAASHLRFATESYVGLPEEMALRTIQKKGARHFRNRGLGLVAVTPTHCRLLVRSRPRRAQADSVLQMHCVERFWRSHVKGS